MLRSRLTSVIGAVVLAGVLGIFVLGAVLQSRALPSAAAAADSSDRSNQTADMGPHAPAIAQIISPSPTCYLPTPGTGACFVQWEYLSVAAASGNYVISMTVSIDNQLRAYHAGFFQPTMFIPHTLTGAGYKVACGTPGSGRTPGWGSSYPFAIKARETGGLKAASYGAVTCPADVANLYLPLIRRK